MSAFGDNEGQVFLGMTSMPAVTSPTAGVVRDLAIMVSYLKGIEDSFLLSFYMSFLSAAGGHRAGLVLRLFLRLALRYKL